MRSRKTASFARLPASFTRLPANDYRILESGKCYHFPVGANGFRWHLPLSDRGLHLKSGAIFNSATAADDLENEQLVSSPPFINSSVSSKLSTCSVFHLTYASICCSVPKMPI